MGIQWAQMSAGMKALSRAAGEVIERSEPTARQLQLNRGFVQGIRKTTTTNVKRNIRRNAELCIQKDIETDRAINGLLEWEKLTKNQVVGGPAGSGYDKFGHNAKRQPRKNRREKAGTRPPPLTASGYTKENWAKYEEEKALSKSVEYLAYEERYSKVYESKPHVDNLIKPSRDYIIPALRYARGAALWGFGGKFAAGGIASAMGADEDQTRAWGNMGFALGTGHFINRNIFGRNIFGGNRGFGAGHKHQHMFSEAGIGRVGASKKFINDFGLEDMFRNKKI